MPITAPVLFEKSFQNLYSESIDRLKVNAPGYTALLSSDPGIAVLDAFLYQTALLGEKLNLLPQASLVAWVNYLGVEKKGSTAAKGTMKVILEEELEEDFIIPLGTRFLDTLGNSFVSVEEVIIEPGDVQGDVPIEAEQRGAIGNVKANQIINLYQNLPFVKEVRNPESLAGGIDSELDVDALDRGRKIIKHLWRAVTKEDYEDLAVSVPGIQRARAIDSPGFVYLYLLSIDGQPANEELRRQALEFLEPRRLQAVALQVLPAGIKTVSVTANVKLLPGYTITGVTTIAKSKLWKVLDPLTWTWGRKIAVSELLGTLEEVPGIDFVDDLILPAENIYLEPYELAKLGGTTLHAV